MKDPIVEQVRRIRYRQAAKHNFDIRKIAEESMRRQYTWGNPVVSLASENAEPDAGELEPKNIKADARESGGAPASIPRSRTRTRKNRAGASLKGRGPDREDGPKSIV